LICVFIELTAKNKGRVFKGLTMNASNRLDGQVIIVTGAGGGIGEGIAKRMAEEGAKVVVSDIRSDAAQRVSQEINANGFCSLHVHTDVTSHHSFSELVERTLDEYKDISVMVNNAGWTHKNQSALSVNEAEFDKCFSVNMKSIYYSTLLVAPVFKKRGGGSFINIASTAGIRPRPGLTWYNSSKGAVITASKSLAAELGQDNIRVNCINPVFNPSTGLSQEFAGGPLDENRLDKFKASIPLGRFSTALDVANAALYLASEDANFISGICLEVDGARCV
jgi:3-oxoacyl-[acyl-carrier protein] reductase